MQNTPTITQYTHQQRTRPNNRVMVRGQNGNAMVYVLVVVALFAALTFVLSRQTDTGEAGTLTAERATLYAGQILSTPLTYKQALNLAIMGGSSPNDIDFVLPTESGFNNADIANNIHKIYHPMGGGLNPAALPAEAIGTGINPPTPGWYMGRFNNVEWSPSTDSDKQEIIVAAYNIRREICAEINRRLTGDPSIPPISNPRDFFVEARHFSGSSNDDLDVSDCPDCEEHLQLCVAGTATPTTYVFYSIMLVQ